MTRNHSAIRPIQFDLMTRKHSAIRPIQFDLMTRKHSAIRPSNFIPSDTRSYIIRLKSWK